MEADNFNKSIGATKHKEKLTPQLGTPSKTKLSRSEGH